MIGPHTDRAVTPDDQRQIARDNGWTALQTHWGNPRTLTLNKDGYGFAKSTYAPNDPFWVFHSAYCAVASPPLDKEKATGDYLKMMLQHARRAHAHAVVVHVGGTKDHTASQVQDRIRTFLLNQDFEGFFKTFQPSGEWPIRLLLENVAANYPFNQNLFHIAEVARQFNQVGWCLDLAHCVSGDSKVLTERGPLAIKDIVLNRMPIRVVSWNALELKFELKSVLNYYSTVIGDLPLTLGVRGFDRRVSCSQEHKFLTPNGMVKAKDLSIGDLIACRERVLTYNQTQLIYGSLLGDAFLVSNQGDYPRLSLQQGDAQKDYFFFKKKIMGHFYDKSNGSGRDTFEHAETDTYRKDGSRVEFYRSSSLVSRVFEPIKKVVYTGELGFKKVTPEWVSKLDLLAFVFWFLDDGSLKRRACDRSPNARPNVSWCVGRRRTRVSTGGVTSVLIEEEEVKILCDKLRELGFQASYKTYPEQYTVSLTAGESERFLLATKDMIPRCMAQKGLEDCGVYWSSEEEERYDLVFYPLEIKTSPTFKKRRVFYDLEVEDTHNYVVHGLVTSNSNAAGIPHDQLLEVIDKHCPNVCHCNYPGSPTGSGRDRHGWRYRADEFNKEHGLTQTQQDQWDEIVRLLHRQKVPLILEGSSTPGSYTEEVRFVRNLVTEMAIKSDVNEHH